MSIIPKIEKITFDASLSHFLLMFGYKLFSLYFPLFLVGQGLSGLMCGFGRSGLLSQKLKKYPEEASAIDTIFSPLGVALGSLISGLIIGFLGFSNLFILGGFFVIFVLMLGKILTQK